MYILKTVLIFLFLWVSNLPISLSAPPVITEEGKGRYPMGLHLDILIDKEAKLTIRDVMSDEVSRQFVPSEWEIPNPGVMGASVWVKFRLQNNMKDRKFILEVPFPPIDLIELYLPSESVRKSGEGVSFDERESGYPNPMFYLSVKTGEMDTVYMRYYDEGSIPIPLILWVSEMFTEHAVQYQYVLGVYYGIILAMIFYNLFLFLSVRDVAYLYYTLYVSAFGIFQLAFNGLAQKYLWPYASVWWSNRLVFFFLGMGVCSVVQFSRSFLHTRDYAPKSDRILLLLMAAVSSEGVLLFFISFSFIPPLLVATSAICIVAMFSTGILCWKNGYLPARYYLISFITLMTGGLLLSFRYIGIIPSNFFTENGVQIGSAAEVILLSLALADRINVLQAEKAKAQKESLENLEKRHELEIRYSQELEEKVRVRTSELEKNKDELKEAFREADAANKQVMDSIHYAKMIQSSLLPDPDEVKERLPDSFFMWMPRDIVGGDIFFTDFFENGFIVSIIDCTGHGIPGALMSMIASSGLRRIIKDEGCHDPAEILTRLNFIIKTTLHQDAKHGLSDDGMDAAVCMVSCPPRLSQQAAETGKLTFAGAKLPLIYVRDNELNIIKGDRQSVGYRQAKRSDIHFKFTNHTLTIRGGMAFYLATDGFEDQMGSNPASRFKATSFGRVSFRNLLREVSVLPFEKQQEMLIKAFHAHKGDIRRQDDVTVVGFGC
ncbi:7TM diverse intracellular signaling domain-containing protein [Desulfococcaceae bacterium HSG8]|nr:7TM diverse intracellular signaling domain-containing protein [Desulfococcaceae bacterium HSG8]